MAVLAVSQISLSDGIITVEADYNAANQRIQTGRCIHTGQSDVRALFYEDGNPTPVFAYTLSPGTTEFPLSNQRIVVNADGNIELPYGYVIQYPWAGG